jgi:P-type Ca2+ transporter type 2C
VAVVLASIAAQLTIHHLPAMDRLFQIAPLSFVDCAISLLLGLVPVTVIELAKLVRRAQPSRARHIA